MSAGRPAAPCVLPRLLPFEAADRRSLRSCAISTVLVRATDHWICRVGPRPPPGQRKGRPDFRALRLTFVPRFRDGDIRNPTNGVRVPQAGVKRSSAAASSAHRRSTLHGRATRRNRLQFGEGLFVGLRPELRGRRDGATPQPPRCQTRVAGCLRTAGCRARRLPAREGRDQTWWRFARNVRGLGVGPSNTAGATCEPQRRHHGGATTTESAAMGLGIRSVVTPHS